MILMRKTMEWGLGCSGANKTDVQCCEISVLVQSWYKVMLNMVHVLNCLHCIAEKIKVMLFLGDFFCHVIHFLLHVV